MKISPYFIFIAIAPQRCASPLPDNGQKSVNGKMMVLSKFRLNNMRKKSLRFTSRFLKQKDGHRLLLWAIKNVEICQIILLVMHS